MMDDRQRTEIRILTVVRQVSEIRNSKRFDMPFGSEFRAELLTIPSEPVLSVVERVEGQI
jgi:hypothetical protein